MYMVSTHSYCILTPMLLDVICCAMRERNFFQAERRNSRCLVSCSGCGGCCSGIDFSLMEWLPSFVLATIATDDDCDSVVAFGCNSLFDGVFVLLFARRDKRNGLRGIENARRIVFFFSLPHSFCVGIDDDVATLLAVAAVVCCDCESTAATVDSFSLAIISAPNFSGFYTTLHGHTQKRSRNDRHTHTTELQKVFHVRIFFVHSPKNTHETSTFRVTHTHTQHTTITFLLGILCGQNQPKSERFLLRCDLFWVFFSGIFARFSLYVVV